jgi:hypothetical protein
VLCDSPFRVARKTKYIDGFRFAGERHHDLKVLDIKPRDEELAELSEFFNLNSSMN